MKLLKNTALAFVAILGSMNAFAQVLSNDPVVSGTINAENPFFDASTNFDPDLSFSNTIGKGLLFPRTDLTSWEFSSLILDGSVFPTAYDGMIVYNTGTGNTPTSGNNPNTSFPVAPGFYYFFNPDGAVNLDVSTGEWIPMGKNGSTITNGTTNPTNGTGNDGDFYINTTTNQIFGPYDNGTWGTPTSIVGATGPQGPAGAQGAQGADGLLTPGTAVGNTTFWNGTEWVVNSSNIFNNGGNVGIGNTTANVKLSVTGAAANDGVVSGNLTTINFANSNLATTSNAGSSFTLNGMVSGGAYTLVTTANVTTSATFTASGFTIRYMATYPRVANKHTIYSIICIGTNAYVSMVTEN